MNFYIEIFLAFFVETETIGKNGGLKQEIIALFRNGNLHTSFISAYFNNK
jgi:hypothetical protein